MKLKIGQIQHKIPIPPDPRGGSNKIYHFNKMKIGDSILISGKSRQSIYYYKRKNPNFHFISRKEGHNYRIWRVNK